MGAACFFCFGIFSLALTKRRACTFGAVPDSPEAEEEHGETLGSERAWTRSRMGIPGGPVALVR